MIADDHLWNASTSDWSGCHRRRSGLDSVYIKVGQARHLRGNVLRTGSLADERRRASPTGKTRHSLDLDKSSMASKD